MFRGVLCQTFPCLMLKENKTQSQRMSTQIYTKRVQSAKSLESLSIRQEFIDTSKGGWRRVGFHLNHMLSFYITADRVRLGR